ncbi:hypothetical protein [Xanthobacter autotrophicus]|uniref:hypothetical protein n=1 Tax=Xanthobacter autotrophicus TaxID=280 RepID=UPI003728CE7A
MAHLRAALFIKLDPLGFMYSTLDAVQVIPVQVLADLPHAGFALCVENIALDQPHADLLDGFKSMHAEFLEAVSRGSAWADDRTSSTARWPAPQEPKVGYRG